MMLGIACLLFQLAPAARLLPLAVSEPAGATAVPSVGAPALDTVTIYKPSRPASAPAQLAEADSNRSASSLFHVTSSVPSTQNSQLLSTIRLPDAQPAKPVPIIGARSLPSRKSWVMLSLAQHGAATFDAYATRRAVASGATESNPLLRPFAGSPSMYAAIQVGPLALDYLASRMQRSQNRFLRRMWWLPQGASTSLFIIAGVHNLHLAH